MFLQCNRAGKHIVCNLPDPNPCYKSRNIELDRYTNFERAKLKWSSGKWGIKFYVQYNVSTLFNVQCTLSLACQKRFYNRETVAVLNYEILNVFHTPFPFFYATKIINPFLNFRISLLSQSWYSGETFSQCWNSYEGDCFSIVEFFVSTFDEKLQK